MTPSYEASIPKNARDSQKISAGARLCVPLDLRHGLSESRETHALIVGVEGPLPELIRRVDAEAVERSVRKSDLQTFEPVQRVLRLALRSKQHDVVRGNDVPIRDGIHRVTNVDDQWQILVCADLVEVSVPHGR